MGRELECTECDFRIRSENQDEVVEFVQDHARQTHGMTMSRTDVQRIWKPY